MTIAAVDKRDSHIRAVQPARREQPAEPHPRIVTCGSIRGFLSKTDGHFHLKRIAVRSGDMRNVAVND